MHALLNDCHVYILGSNSYSWPSISYPPEKKSQSSSVVTSSSLKQALCCKEITAVDSNVELMENLNTDLYLLGLDHLKKRRVTLQEPSNLASVNSSEKHESSRSSSFTLLPKETLHFLLSYLDLKSLINLSRVCRLLHEAVQDPQLYTNLCLKSLFHLVSDKCLMSFSTKCTFLAHLDLSWCGNYGKVSPTSLALFVRKCGKYLQTLRLANCHSCNGAVVKQIASTCTALMEINLSNCHLLESQEFEPLGWSSGLNRLVCINFYRTQVGPRSLYAIIENNKR